MGTGVSGYGGEGGLPEEVVLYWPIDLAYDAEGRLLVLDWNNFRVRRLDEDGHVRTILGTGFEAEETINGMPALETPLHHTFSMSFDRLGNLYLAGNHVPVILRMDTQELVWTVAGGVDPGYSGDEGPASEAALNTPCGVAVSSDGFPIYVADTFNHCIRAIDGEGIIRTIAGSDTAGYAGDGGPALDAQLRSPYRIRLDEATGSLYICDVGNHCVRRIDAAGVITTVAGTGTAGFSGDGGPAGGAELRSPLDARIGPDGLLYIADTYNNRIRRIDASGIIRTVAGSGMVGKPQNSLEGGPALSVDLNHPAALAFSPDGDLYIADTYSSVVRRVRLQP